MGQECGGRPGRGCPHRHPGPREQELGAAGNEWGSAGGAVGRQGSQANRECRCNPRRPRSKHRGGGDPGRGPAPAGGSPPRCHVPPASGSARTRCSLRLRGAPSHGGARARPRSGADTGAGRASRPREQTPPGLDPGHCATDPPPGSLRPRPAPCRRRLRDVIAPRHNRFLLPVCEALTNAGLWGVLPPLNLCGYTRERLGRSSKLGRRS